MAPSTRTPSKKQVEVLDALRRLQQSLGVDEAVSFSTLDVLKWVSDLHHYDVSLVNVMNALNACVRHEWVRVRTTGPNEPGLARGANLAWSLLPAGIEAFGRAQGSTDQPKEDPVEGTTTATPPWSGEDAPTQPEEIEGQETIEGADPEALGELDEQEEDAGEGELEEDEVDDNPPVNEGSNQLSLAIGGPKPKSSILKIMTKQQKFGTTKQWKNMERIPFSGYLEVRGVAIDVQANGFVQRLQKAVISELVIDGVDVSDNDD
jgi:hypothetical protein